MLVDPLQTPTSWMSFNIDQHRISVPTTPGITGCQSDNSWLSLLKAVVELVKEWNFFELEIIPPLLSAVIWILEKTGIDPPFEGRSVLLSSSLAEDF